MTLLEAMKIVCAEHNLPHQVFNEIVLQNPIQDVTIPEGREEEHLQAFRDAISELTQLPVEVLEEQVAHLDYVIAERIKNN